jgi:alcohol dehydrogenase class IV
LEEGVAQAGGEGGDGADPAPDPVQWLIREIDALFSLFDLPENLKGFGVDAGDIPEIARRSSGSSMSGNPRELSQEERESMIAELL